LVFKGGKEGSKGTPKTEKIRILQLFSEEKGRKEEKNLIEIEKGGMEKQCRERREKKERRQSFGGNLLVSLGGITK